MCTELEKPAQAQKYENDQRHLFLHKMRAKYELRVLKSNIDVVLLCIQQVYYFIYAHSRLLARVCVCDIRAVALLMVLGCDYIAFILYLYKTLYKTEAMIAFILHLYFN